MSTVDEKASPLGQSIPTEAKAHTTGTAGHKLCTPDIVPSSIGEVLPDTVRPEIEGTLYGELIGTQSLPPGCPLTREVTRL
jgi:hypothetical protein